MRADQRVTAMMSQLVQLVMMLMLYAGCAAVGEVTGGTAVAAQSDIPRNDAVRWQGIRFGLFPALADVDDIMKQGQQAVPSLLDALEDADRFVTAHVLLTRIAGVQHETFPEWNSLEVDLRADGTVRIDPEQRHGLARRWKSFFDARPRPVRLPDK